MFGLMLAGTQGAFTLVTRGSTRKGRGMGAEGDGGGGGRAYEGAEGGGGRLLPVWVVVVGVQCFKPARWQRPSSSRHRNRDRGCSAIRGRSSSCLCFFFLQSHDCMHKNARLHADWFRVCCTGESMTSCV